MQRTASERKKVNRRVNQRFLSALVEMGVPSEQAELALSETGNVGVEVAAEWLFRCVFSGVAQHSSCMAMKCGRSKFAPWEPHRHALTCNVPFALCSVPQDVLESHLAADPGTPVEELGAVHDDNRVLVPKRVALQVRVPSWRRACLLLSLLHRHS